MLQHVRNEENTALATVTLEAQLQHIDIHKLRIATFILPSTRGGGAEATLSVTAIVTVTVSVPEVRATHPTVSHPSLMYF